MDDTLLAAYRATAYRVRLALGGWATIRIDEPPPIALSEFIGEHTWAFITAWNPFSRPASRSANRLAQRELLMAVRGLSATLLVKPGCGTGPAGWCEPSLFVVGPNIASLDGLAHRYRQNAYLHGQGALPARLRLPR